MHPNHQGWITASSNFGATGEPGAPLYMGGVGGRPGKTGPSRGAPVGVDAAESNFGTEIGESLPDTEPEREKLKSRIKKIE
jgi:hypothetical protein